MIGTIDIEIQAANPSMPLYPIRAFVNSPTSVRLRNVPKKIGQWNITSVQIVAAYPDSSIKTANCVLIGGVWVGTIEGCAISGKSENGFTVFASGIDENGDAVSNYVLGKGLIEILEADGTISPDTPSYYVHLYDEEPTAKKEGDLWKTGGSWYIWQDGAAVKIGDILTDEQLAAIQSLIDERETVVHYRDFTISSLNIVGELSANSIPNIDYVDTVKVGTAVTSIGNGAFYGISLTSVTIPDSVTSIGSNAFQGSGLNTITIPGSVTSIGNDAFRNCAQLTDVIFEEGVTSIGERAFRGSSVVNATIPKSVTSIGRGAFEDALNV